ncbi:uncharacterized protein LOC141619808 [Silene latifolia]|uniref:uncharacterized protein LOC141619808 n=1 Tax=Silene latifolia TaxID=37657 RepID=UPI003D76CB26
MVEESELVNRLREILRKSDLNTTSAGAVRRQLESDFGVDLSDRKKFISQLIDDIIHQEHQDKDDEDKDKDDGDDDDEEEEATTSPRSNSLEEEDEEEETPKKETEKKRGGGGFAKLCSLSPSLEDFFQVSEMARTQVVKKLWEYIRENDLQDPSNRRNIKCDDKLRSIFRVDKINMFQMNKVLSKHIWPLQIPNESSVTSAPPPQKKRKRQTDDHDTDVQKTKGKAKQHNGGTSALLMPLHLSEAFVKFLGTGETTLSRPEAVKRIWGYIKQNDLQDPSDKRQILCDEKLKELFEVDTFHGFSMSKYLKTHLSKVEQ